MDVSCKCNRSQCKECSYQCNGTHRNHSSVEHTLNNNFCISHPNNNDSSNSRLRTKNISLKESNRGTQLDQDDGFQQLNQYKLYDKIGQVSTASEIS